MSDSDAGHPFRRAAENGDIDRLLATLAPDVVLHSPVTFQPYVGKESVSALLRLVMEMFEYWRCTAEIQRADGVTALIFDARIGERELEGLDLLRPASDGRIADLTVMIRPFTGLAALAQAIGPKVESAGLKPKQHGCSTES